MPRRTSRSRLARHLPVVGPLLRERDALRSRNRQLRRSLRQAAKRRKHLRRRLTLARQRSASWLGPYEHASAGELGYLFIITYARSGSTLLAGILSSTPGFLIRGENAQAPYELFRFHKRVVERRELHGKWAAKRQGHPWAGIEGYDDATAFAAIRRLMHATLLRPAPGTRVVGYKEIRWWQPDVVEFVRFLQEVFPGARFVINTRRHEDVLRSKIWDEIDDAQNVIESYEQVLTELTDALGDSAFRVHYDDYANDPTVLKPLFDWLGEDYDEARIRAVMEVRHSY